MAEEISKKKSQSGSGSSRPAKSPAGGGSSSSKRPAPKSSGSKSSAAGGAGSKSRTGKSTSSKSSAPKAAGAETTGAGQPSSGQAKEGTAAKRLEKVEKAVGESAARVGRQTKELGSAVQKRVEQDLGPLAEKAGKELGKAQRAFGRFLKTTARATKKSARILGIKSQISAKLREADRMYQSIGERYYQGQKKSLSASDLAREIKPIIDEIDRLMADIAGLEAEEKAVRQSP